jgi:putative toxin-antitoxin system antitoxin component (TIGR02293 family)
MKTTTPLPDFVIIAWESPLQMIDTIRSGVLKIQADQTAEAYSLTSRDMARILQISERSYHRYQPDMRLDAVSTERLLQLQKLYELGKDVFEDLAKFNRWLKRPLRVLGNRTPFELLDTNAGMRLIEDELWRIEQSVYA